MSKMDGREAFGKHFSNPRPVSPGDARRLAAATHRYGVNLARVDRAHMRTVLGTLGIASHVAMTSADLVEAFTVHHLCNADVETFVKCPGCGGEASDALAECPYCDAPRS